MKDDSLILDQRTSAFRHRSIRDIDCKTLSADLNGVYDPRGYFWPIKTPTSEDRDVSAHTIAIRVLRFLEKAGCLVRDAGSEYVALVQDEEDAMGAIVGASITYCLAFCPNVGRKALMEQFLSRLNCVKATI